MDERGREDREGSGGNPTDEIGVQTATALTQIAQYLKRQEAQGRNLEDAEDVALERFRKLGPPKFNGESGDEKAEKWIEAMEDVYQVLKYTDERKISFGGFQLEGIAKAWWRIVEERWKQEGKRRTWSAFLEEFRNKFIPLVVRERKEREFMYLKQGNLTVTQYEIQFTKLSKYAPEMVNTEEKRMKRFLQGLELEIQDPLVTTRIGTYAEAVEYAQRKEDIQARLKESRKFMRKEVKCPENPKEKVPSGLTMRQQTGVKGCSKKRSREVSRSMLDSKKKPQVRCRYCRKLNHQESECWRKIKKCLRCGSSRHQVGECTVA